MTRPGILKIEPKEADQLPVPSRSTIEATERKLRTLRPQLAKGLRQGNLLEVVEEVDRVLRVHLKLSRANLDLLRAARRTLFNRRIARSRAQ